MGRNPPPPSLTPPPVDLCDATRSCWLPYAVIIQLMSGDQRRPLLWPPGSLKCLRPNALLAEAVSRLPLRSDDSFWQGTLGSLRKSPNKVLSVQTPVFFPRYFLPPSVRPSFSRVCAPYQNKAKQGEETNIRRGHKLNVRFFLASPERRSPGYLLPST